MGHKTLRWLCPRSCPRDLAAVGTLGALPSILPPISPPTLPSCEHTSLATLSCVPVTCQTPAYMGMIWCLLASRACWPTVAPLQCLHNSDVLGNEPMAQWRLQKPPYPPTMRLLPAWARRGPLGCGCAQDWRHQQRSTRGLGHGNPSFRTTHARQHGMRQPGGEPNRCCMLAASHKLSQAVNFVSTSNSLRLNDQACRFHNLSCHVLLQ